MSDTESKTTSAPAPPADAPSAPPPSAPPPPTTPRSRPLDEPSTGLDPGALRDLWETLEALRASGVTVLLTTHFMDEGDRCDRLVLLSRGAVVAEGTPAALK